VGSASAAKVVQLVIPSDGTAHGETFILNKSVEIKVTLANWSQAARKWLSPQGDRKWLDSLLRAWFHSPSLQKVSRCRSRRFFDLALPLVGPIIKEGKVP